MKKRTISVLLIVLMAFQSVMPAYGESRPIYDPLEMLDLLNEKPLGPSVNLPSVNTGVSVPNLPSPTGTPLLERPSEIYTGPLGTARINNPVNPETGLLDLEVNDVFVDALGYDLTLTRYQSNDLGSFGMGWDLNFYTELKMYSGYDIAEIRLDGTKRAYEFVENGNHHVTSYDGDSLVNYKLHLGSYKTAAGDRLERISQYEYKVTTKDDEVLIYRGYRAPWRAGDPMEGKLLSRTDRFGHTLSYEYDNGRLSALVNGDRRLDIKYNSKGFISEMIDPLGQSVYFEYTDNFLTKVYHEEGVISEYGYSDNKLTSLSEKGFTQDFTYTEDQITRVSYENQTLYTLSYDNKTTVTNAYGGIETFKYLDGHLVEYKDLLGDTYTYTFEDNLLIEESSKAGTISYTYEDNQLIKKEDLFSVTNYLYEDDLLKSETDESGTTSYVYENELLIEKHAPLGSEYFEYNEQGLLVSIINKAGHKTAMTYDALGYISSKDFEGHVTAYTYDTVGRLLTETSPEGHVTEFTYNRYGEKKIDDTEYFYDSYGRVKSISSPDLEKVYTFIGKYVSSVTENGVTTTFDRDRLGQVTMITTNSVKNYVYDSAGRTIQVEEDGYVIDYIYGDDFYTIRTRDGVMTTQTDELSRPVSVTDDRGREISYIYENENLVKVISPEGLEKSYSYDLYGNITEVTDFTGVTIAYSYDRFNRVISEKIAGKTTTYTYDIWGNLVTTSVGGTLVSEYLYNKDNQMIGSGDGVNFETYVYEDDQLISVIDAFGYETKYVYEKGNIIEIQMPNGGSITYTYEGELVTSVTDPLGHTTSFSYDEKDRITEYTNNSGTIQIAYTENQMIVTDVMERKAVYTYNEKDELIEVIKPNGDTLSFTYDSYGNLISSTDYLGVTHYLYNDMDQLISVTNPKGLETLYEYDIYGRMTKKTTGDFYTDYTYNAYGQVTETYNQRGHLSSYFYNDTMALEKVIDANGYSTTYGYDSFGRVTSIIDAEGNTEWIRYDARGQVDEREDTFGLITSYDYDGLGQATSVTVGDQVSSYSYDLLGNVTCTTDALGNRTTYTYNANNQIEKVTDPLGRSTRITYNPSGQMTEMIDPAGYRTAFEYDIMDNLIKTTDALNQVTAYVYENNLLTEIIYPDGYSDRFEYDLDQVISSTDRLGQETIFEYDLFGRLLSSEKAGIKTEKSYNDLEGTVTSLDPLGRETIEVYDQLGQLTSRKDYLGTETYDYDHLGNLTNYTNVLGFERTFEYESNRLVKAYDFEGNLTTYSYDLYGNISSVIDALGHKTQYAYNDNNQVTQVIQGDQSSYKYDYNAVGNISEVINPLGMTTKYEYDSRNNLIQETIVGKTINFYRFDGLNRMTDMATGTGRTYSYSYDMMGNMISEESGLGTKNTYHYDLLGRVTEVIDSLGNTTSYNYNRQGQVAELVYPTGISKEFSYDDLGRVLSVNDGDGVVSYDYTDTTVSITDEMGATWISKYDHLLRPIEEITPKGHSTKYAYDRNNNLIEITSPSGYVTTYDYNANNQLSQITDALHYTTSYGYDSQGNLNRVTDGNGHTRSYAYDGVGNLIHEINPLNQMTSYTYNQYSELIKKEDGRVVNTFSYNSDGLMTRADYGDSFAAYEYDAYGRLISMSSPVSKETYTYDIMNNMTSQYNQTTDKLKTFTYDNFGNMTKMVNAEDRVFSYAYDSRNRLETFVDPDEHVTSYFYDQMDRQIKKILPNGQTEEKIYDEEGYLKSLINRNDQEIISSFDYTYDSEGYRTSIVEEDGAVTGFKYDPLGRVIEVVYPIQKLKTDTEGVASFKPMTLDTQVASVFEVLSDIPEIKTYFAAPSHAKNDKTSNGSAKASTEKVTGQDKNSDKVTGRDKKADGNVIETSSLEVLLKELSLTTTDYFTGVYSKVTYSYDGVGNRLSMTSDNQSIHYSYNASNQLLSAGSKSFEYDSSGNMIQSTVEQLVGEDLIENSTDYVYDGKNRLVEVNFSNETFAHYAYDGLDRLVERETTRYDEELLDAYNKSVKTFNEKAVNKGKSEKTNNGQAKKEKELPKGLVGNEHANANAFKKYDLDALEMPEYATETEVFDYIGTSTLQHKIYSENGSPMNEYYYANGEVVAQKMFGLKGRITPGQEETIKTNGGMMYYSYDGLGSVISLSNRHGDLIEDYRYDVFGNIQTGVTSPYNMTGYTGQMYDDKSSLVYMNARWYNPNIGRFVNEDTWQGSVSNPQTQNKYAYVLNNPVNFTDPTGNLPTYISVSAAKQMSRSTATAKLSLMGEIWWEDYDIFIEQGHYTAKQERAHENANNLREAMPYTYYYVGSSESSVSWRHTGETKYSDRIVVNYSGTSTTTVTYKNDFNSRYEYFSNHYNKFETITAGEVSETNQAYINSEFGGVDLEWNEATVAKYGDSNVLSSKPENTSSITTLEEIAYLALSGRNVGTTIHDTVGLSLYEDRVNEGTGKTGSTNNNKTFGYYVDETYVAIVDGMEVGVENVVHAIEHPFQTIGNAALGAVALGDTGVKLLMFDRETNAMINEAVVGYFSNNSYQEVVKDASSLATSSYLTAAAGSAASNIAKTSGLSTSVNYYANKALNAIDDAISKIKGTSNLIDPKLMDELAASGEKFTEEAVEMVTKNTDGKLLWLETGSESAGLTHIMKHEADLLAKGVDVTDIPGFIKNDLLTQAPTFVGRNAKGPYAEYLVNGNKFRLAYGDNGFIVSLFPIN